MGRLLLDEDAARPWPVALALDGQRPRPIGAVVARDAREAARAALSRWPVLPVNGATVDGVMLIEALGSQANDRQTAPRMTDKPDPRPLTVGQQRYRDRLAVHRAGRRSAAQRLARQAKDNPRPA